MSVTSRETAVKPGQPSPRPLTSSCEPSGGVGQGREGGREAAAPFPACRLPGDPQHLPEIPLDVGFADVQLCKTPIFGQGALEGASFG